MAVQMPEKSGYISFATLKSTIRLQNRDSPGVAE